MNFLRCLGAALLAAGTLLGAVPPGAAADSGVELPSGFPHLLRDRLRLRGHDVSPCYDILIGENEQIRKPSV